MIKRQGQQGFTIVELLIVIVVIAILAAIVIVAYSGIQQQARESAAQQEASSALKKVQAYRVVHADTLPETLEDAGIKDAGATTYQYWKNPDASFGTFCLTAISNGVSSHAASTGTTVPGPCPGHTGAIPKKLDCPSGFITVPGNALFNTDSFCVMKYEAKNVGGTATSVAAGTPWNSISQSSAKTAAAGACSGCHLMKGNEWLTIAHNIMSVPSNWSGGAVGNGYLSSGHNDNNPSAALAASTNDSDSYYGVGAGDLSARQQRTFTLTNGEVLWDFAGNLWEQLDDTITGGQPGLPGDSVEVYKNFNANGIIRGNMQQFFPAYGNPQAAAWGNTQGLGQMFTNSNDSTSTRLLIMGGAFTTGYVNGGIFTFRLNNPPDSAIQINTSTGFRVAR